MSQEQWRHLVEHLVNVAGTERARAEAHADKMFPAVAASRVLVAARDAKALETAETIEIAKHARVMKFKVRSTSQFRASQVARGLPDLWITHERNPRRIVGSHEPMAFAMWWETKRQVGGKRSSEQLDFGGECIDAGIPYGYGDRFDWLDYVESRGFKIPAGIPRLAPKADF